MKFFTKLFLAIIFLSAGEVFAQGAGSALKFDGINDYASITMSNRPTYSKEASFDLWFNTTQTTPGMAMRNIGNLKNGVLVNKFNSGSVLGFSDGTSNNEVYDYGSNLNDGKWHHFAFVHKNDTVKIYVDGILAGAKLETLVMATGSTEHHFGTNQLNHTQFEGLIDEARVWNYALSESEIRKLVHNTVLGTTPGLTAYYNFNGTSTSVIDSSISSNDGKLVNGALRVTSTAPLGRGTTSVQTVSSPGRIKFPNTDVEIVADVTFKMDIAVTKIINTEPAGTTYPAFEKFGKYWIIRNYESTANYTDLEFDMDPSELNIGDRWHPSNIVLYNRPFNSDSGWVLVDTAYKVDDINGKVYFKTVNTTGQFVLARFADVSSTGDIKHTNVNIYPNPASGNTTLSVSGQGSKNMQFELYNSEGKMVRSGMIKGTSLELNNLESGIYYISVYNEKELVRKKLIVF